MSPALISILAAVALSKTVSAMAQQHDVAATMGWLAGCWAAEGKEFGSGETWLQPAGGTMLGVGRTIRSGRTVDFEFMRITTNTEGRLIFVAIPSGQRQTTFIATTTGPDEAVFENPEHDFPQRVMYRKRGSDAAVARIEGLRGGVVRGIDFPMRRVSCEPAK